MGRGKKTPTPNWQRFSEPRESLEAGNCKRNLIFSVFMGGRVYIYIYIYICVFFFSWQMQQLKPQKDDLFYKSSQDGNLDVIKSPHFV